MQLTSFFKTTGLISLYKKVQYDWDSVGQSALEGKGAGIVRNLIVTPFWAKQVSLHISQLALDPKIPKIFRTLQAIKLNHINLIF